MATNNAVNVGLSGSTGSGNFVGATSPTIVTPTLSGNTTVSGGDLTVTTATASTERSIFVRNTDNTSGTSNSALTATTGGSSSGDPKLVMTVTGANSWGIGIDNSDSDKLKIDNSATVGASTKLAIGTDGNVTIGSNSAGLIMNNNTASYSPSTLNYYEATSVSMSVSGAWSQTVTLEITRIGRQVFLQYPDLSTNSASAATLASATGDVPVRFRPMAPVNWIVWGQNAGANISVAVYLATNGKLTWSLITGGAFTVATAAAAWSGCVSFNV